ncbi:MAG: FAD-dependent thymidylate synthase, partial [Chlorobi bacterium]|nr:FAD-dependent thymidylate synthase [Chlorobiota bacterium]
MPPRQLNFTPEPRVELYKAFDNPFRNALATARTCYSSKGIIDDDDIDIERWSGLARSIYKAGHHTTFQHAHFQFRLSNVSRQFIWSFLHSHPFYNSEQVSQRYVKMKPGNYAIPPLDDAAHRVFTETVERQTTAYERLIEMLIPAAGEAYFSHFPYRRKNADAWKKDIRKKAMEIARYVLPVATHAYLYHTISGVTLLRYWRMCRSFDAPLEQKTVVEKMVRALIAFDPSYELVLEDPLEEEAFPEQWFFQGRDGRETAARDFIREFDDRLGDRCSLLVDFSARAEETLARAVR